MHSFKKILHGWILLKYLLSRELLFISATLTSCPRELHSSIEPHTRRDLLLQASMRGLQLRTQDHVHP